MDESLKTIHGSCHVATSLDPASTLGIEDLRCCRYWLIGAWFEFKSPSIDYSSLVALGFEGFGCATWGALVLMTICGPAHTRLQCNIPNLSSIKILGGLMNGSTCMFKVFISVCCASGFGMMI